MVKNRSLNTIKYIIMAIHAVLTFLFSKIVYRNIGYIPSGTKPIKEIVSLNTEIIIAYIFSEIFALIIIFCLWTLVFHVIQNFNKSYLIFVVLYLVGTIFLFILWPEVFTYRNMHMNDNLTTYASALRLTPDYWHSFYLSIVYAASMLVIPAKFSISLFQWSTFMFALAYIYYKAKKHSPKLRYVIFTVFLFPNALEFITYSHRVCMYMSVVAIYIAIICFDMLEKRERKLIDYIWIAAFAAFISVWRSEGIIIGALTFLIYVIYGSRRNVKFIIGRLAIYGLFFVLISVPQKIGDAKYYGKDYTLMNSFDTLYYILNSDEADFEYTGANDDLEAIDNVVPLQVIKEYSTEGYRSYNVNVRGNKDINQSMVGVESANKYIDAYHNIIKHNIGLTAKVKINLILKAFGFKPIYELQEYSGEHVWSSEWHYDGWDIGYAEYYSSNFITKWRNVPIKSRIAEKVFRVARNYYNFTFESGIYAFLIVCMIIANTYIAIRGLIGLIKKKQEHINVLGAIRLVNLMSFFAITIVMPAPAYFYFFPSFCVMTLVIYIYLIGRRSSIA